MTMRWVKSTKERAFCGRQAICRTNYMAKGPICPECSAIVDEVNALHSIRSSIGGYGRKWRDDAPDSRAAFWTEGEADRIVFAAARRLPALLQATFWRRMYREDLYGCSRFERRLADKFAAATAAARRDISKLMDRYGVKRLFYDGHEEFYGLSDAPAWGGNARYGHLYEQLRRRRDFWQARGNHFWYRHWHLRYIAVSYLKERWPCSPSALRRAERYLRNLEDDRERDRIHAEAREERRQAEAEQHRRRLEMEISQEAKRLLAEIIPGLRVAKRARKAQAFEVLVQLLEKSDVDSKTKEAIGRLREFVEAERGASSSVH